MKAIKCSFFQKEIEFLGMWVSEQGVRMDEEKVHMVIDWKPPSQVKGVRSFLGLANFYRQFIP